MQKFLFYTFFFSIAIQFIYYIIVICVWSKLFITKKTKSTNFTAPQVSIVICGKNESKNIVAYLPKVLSQDYPVFEVIFVNDYSTDNSLDELIIIQNKFPNLKIINIDKNNEIAFKKGKKYALTLGIESAKYEWILLTDADCYPNSNNWISSMVNPLKNNKVKIVLGYSPYNLYNSFLSKFISFETAYTAISYMTFCKLGYTYMGVGRNLLYQKKLFFEKNGFSQIQKNVAGDDDLLIQKIATSSNVDVVFNSKSWIISKPKRTIKDYINQKIRHVSVSNEYNIKSKFLLGIIGISQIWSNFSIILLLILKISTMFVWYIYICRLLFILLVYGIFFNRFHNFKIFLSLPLLDILYSIMNVIISPSIFFRNLFEWK